MKDVVYGVYVGAHSLAKATGTETMMTVDRVILHEFYNTTEEYSNDIAVLHLTEDIPFDNNVRTVCLPDVEVPAGTECTVAGWGETMSLTTDPSLLYEVNVPIMDTAICQTYNGLHSMSEAEQLCAGYEEGKKDSCTGDSGGPLVYKQKSGQKSGRWFQAGIVSFGAGCAEEYSPGIYTKVSNYLDWIVEKTKPEIDFSGRVAMNKPKSVNPTITENKARSVNPRIAENKPIAVNPTITEDKPTADNPIITKKSAVSKMTASKRPISTKNKATEERGTIAEDKARSSSKSDETETDKKVLISSLIPNIHVIADLKVTFLSSKLADNATIET